MFVTRFTMPENEPESPFGGRNLNGVLDSTKPTQPFLLTCFTRGRSAYAMQGNKRS